MLIRSYTTRKIYIYVSINNGYTNVITFRINAHNNKILISIGSMLTLRSNAIMGIKCHLINTSDLYRSLLQCLYCTQLHLSSIILSNSMEYDKYSNISSEAPLSCAIFTSFIL